jgi:hypothetical protein
MPTETEVDAKFDALIRRAARREAEMMLGRAGEVDDCAGCWWKLTSAHMRIVVPALATILGSALTFVIATETAVSRHAAQLQSEANLVAELKNTAVSRDVFDATVGPIKKDIGDIKAMLLDLQKMKPTRSDEVIYRTYKMAAASQN